jgi:HNH endonuclease
MDDLGEEVSLVKCGRPATIGDFAGVSFRTWFPDGGPEDRVFVCYLSDEQDIPIFLKPVFRKHFFGSATCVKCFRPMAALQFRSLREHDRRRSTQNAYVVCGCGHPLWRIGPELLGIAETSMGEAIRYSRRRQRMRAAGGRHSSEEVEDILGIQKHRCFYCNRRFTDKVRWERDHLASIASGGADWALNIVMACKSCNSRRCDIPFRTFCKLLSPTRNKRMLMCLYRRIVALDPDNLPYEALATLDLGLAEHDPQHWRYRDIRDSSPEARKYASKNPLFPRSVALILKKGQAAK